MEGISPVHGTELKKMLAIITYYTHYHSHRPVIPLDAFLPVPALWLTISVLSRLVLPSEGSVHLEVGMAGPGGVFSL